MIYKLNQTQAKALQFLIILNKTQEYFCHYKMQLKIKIQMINNFYNYYLFYLIAIVNFIIRENQKKKFSF